MIKETSGFAKLVLKARYETSIYVYIYTHTYTALFLMLSYLIRTEAIALSTSFIANIRWKFMQENTIVLL